MTLEGTGAELCFDLDGALAPSVRPGVEKWSGSLADLEQRFPMVQSEKTLAS